MATLRASRSTALPDLLRDGGCSNEEILESFACTPRHEFLDAGLRSRALDNSALPIGHGQTTSQPQVMARMLELAWQPEQCANVLEIGAGSGYMAALLSTLYEQVFAIERIRALAVAAARRIQQLGYNNVHILHDDGKLGLEKNAPYDAIVVSAAGASAPQTLLNQLSECGRLVMPEKVSGGHERLIKYSKERNGTVRTEHEHVAFVPLLKGVA